MWGRFGPYDAFSLRKGWFSGHYLAIDQLSIVCMVENYRSGLLWQLFMSDRDVRAGLQKAGITEPVFAPGFPEAVITLKKDGDKYMPDACDLRRHPDSGQYCLVYYTAEPGQVSFMFTDANGTPAHQVETAAIKGRNLFLFQQFAPTSDTVFTLTMRTTNGEYVLPIRLH
jgi:hypothetical protein